MPTPWDELAAVDLYRGGLERRPGVFKGTLREAVTYALSQRNADGDGYIIRMGDGSRKWEGQAIQDLGRELFRG